MAGCPAAHLAVEMGVSRATAYKWLAWYRLEGTAGLLERSSRPHRSPNRTSAVVGAQILALRRGRRLGPVRIAAVLELNPATVHRVLVRAGMPRLAWLDGPPGAGASLRTSPTRRAGIRRREEARPSARGRWLASPGTWITDNALAYRRSRAWHDALGEIGADAASPAATGRVRPATG